MFPIGCLLWINEKYSLLITDNDLSECDSGFDTDFEEDNVDKMFGREMDFIN